MMPLLRFLLIPSVIFSSLRKFMASSRIQTVISGCVPSNFSSLCPVNRSLTVFRAIVSISLVLELSVVRPRQISEPREIVYIRNCRPSDPVLSKACTKCAGIVHNADSLTKLIYKCYCTFSMQQLPFSLLSDDFACWKFGTWLGHTPVTEYTVVCRHLIRILAFTWTSAHRNARNGELWFLNSPPK